MQRMTTYSKTSRVTPNLFCTPDGDNSVFLVNFFNCETWETIMPFWGLTHDPLLTVLFASLYI